MSDSAADKRVDIAICVASRRRPHGLHALLGGIGSQTFRAAAPSVRVFVADNDAAGSARPVVEDARAWHPYPIAYCVEPRFGIPQARNAALAEALGCATWIAFVDDDEVPAPGWLDALLCEQRRSAADVVTGPAVPRFVQPPPRWITEGGFFAAARRRSGAVLQSAYTNNALVRASALLALEMLFDPRMVPMGEDTELFERLARRGHRIVWADDAVVYDDVPPERATLRWLLRRSFRSGRARTRIGRLHAARERAGSVVAHSARCLVRGALRSMAARRESTGQRATGLVLAAYGAGRLAELAGRPGEPGR